VLIQFWKTILLL